MTGGPGPWGPPAALPRLGPWLLEQELGRGSFGAVFRARHAGLPGPVALKVLLVDLADAELVTRFRLEAAIGQKLDHPGIVRTLGVEQHGGRLAFAMELVDGPSLAHVLRGGPLAPERARALVADLARAVGHAHRHGVVHRDLKPANVLVCARTGQPRVTDFGLARDRSLLRSLTQSGDVLGSPLYMAPEQVEGRKDLDARADVWALGAVLYECLTGTPAFLAQTAVDVAARIREARPTPPRALRPDVPPALERVCLQALARDPAARFPDAGALAAALDALAPAPAAAPRPGEGGASGASASPDARGTAPVLGPAADDEAAAARTRPAPGVARPRRAARAATLLACLACLAGLAGLALGVPGGAGDAEGAGGAPAVRATVTSTPAPVGAAPPAAGAAAGRVGPARADGVAPAPEGEAQGGAPAASTSPSASASVDAALAELEAALTPWRRADGAWVRRELRGWARAVAPLEARLALLQLGALGPAPGRDRERARAGMALAGLVAALAGACDAGAAPVARADALQRLAQAERLLPGVPAAWRPLAALELTRLLFDRGRYAQARALALEEVVRAREGLPVEVDLPRPMAEQRLLAAMTCLWIVGEGLDAGAELGLLAAARLDPLMAEKVRAVRLRRTDKAQALAAARAVLAADPADVDTRATRAFVLLQVEYPGPDGRREALLQALADADAAIAAAPEHGRAWYMRARVAQGLGRPDEALVAFARALALFGDEERQRDVERDARGLIGRDPALADRFAALAADVPPAVRAAVLGEARRP